MGVTESGDGARTLQRLPGDLQPVEVFLDPHEEASGLLWILSLEGFGRLETLLCDGGDLDLRLLGRSAAGALFDDGRAGLVVVARRP